MSRYSDHFHLAISELGEPEAIFRISLPRFLFQLSLSVLLLVVGFLINYLWWVHGPQKMDHLAMLLLIPPVLGLVVLGRLLRQRGLTVLLYPSGLLYLCRGQALVFLWQEITEVWLHFSHLQKRMEESDAQGVRTACILCPAVSFWDDLLNSSLTLVRQDGARVQLTPAVGDYHQLLVEVQRRTFPRLWQKAWDQFREQGQAVFGPLVVRPDGLHWSKAFLPWEQFDGLRIRQGDLLVRQKKLWKTWRETPVNTLPNLPVLWALVEAVQVLNQSHPSSQSTSVPAGEAQAEEPEARERLS
ncbi:DUF6585 family protein [Thermogemmata fonticola]|uniref:Uncharacterized protein n=1 Tax=Thermogemmata fonticola TaxID=2755323 RepID=A0A7V8VDT7_9BACT|nr:DUF6585 family protein [Thermogemmata fonticola]MBA2226185.1 hypothetical protein [Thermogemmata fonticola]